jgi:hypothetical protein
MLSIAGVQYGMVLARGASAYPNPDAGQIVSMIQGPRGAWYNVYVTVREYRILNGLLCGAALSLLASLGLIVVHGVRHLRASQAPAASSRGKR